jgi:hypothetical protein
LLDDFGLQEHVRTPTHKKGHQLDVFITRTNQPVSTIRVDPPLMSDHSLIVASIDVISRRPTENKTVMRRHWRSFDVDVFVAELERSRLVIDPPHDVTERFDCYNATLGQLLDKMAPKCGRRGPRPACQPRGSTSNVML